MDKSLKTKQEVLEEKIVDDTFKVFESMSKKSRPREINIYNANPASLVRIMIGLQDKFKKLKYEPTIFINESKNGRYIIDVGYYLDK